MNHSLLHIHLVSDSTGETVHQVARAALAQFPDVQISEHIWTLVRSPAHVETIASALNRNPGILLYSVVDPEIRKSIEKLCIENNTPGLSVLDPLMDLLSSVLGYRQNIRPGGQHKLDKAYFDRMAAVEFAVNHDDGLNMDRLKDAQILLVGVSRTSKTPTSMYLANRGYRVANYALVPNVSFPMHLVENIPDLFVVGLTTDAKRLSLVRRNRLQHMSDSQNDSYADLDLINEELKSARRLFSNNKWPVLDVSRRSIEETAAAILHLYANQREKKLNAQIPNEAPS
ncbi:MAG: phosphoenolpyruvate synthase regulatory protein [Rhodospirillaceae bacterium]|nr:phosphoenolpyruvate synthase regulatory protein [Rhodospirillaceae bacterium]|tara:strand:+ start:940 stop:1797 length:858 start_codon:yes stop_codon:yes gene_type:complete